MAKRGNPNIVAFGIKSRFTAENAAEMAKKGNDKKRKDKALQELLEKDVPLELVANALKQGVVKGDPRLLELLLKLLGLMPKEQLDLTVNEPRKFEFVLKK